jgi:anti-anti-sigma regulatory factor
VSIAYDDERDTESTLTLIVEKSAPDGIRIIAPVGELGRESAAYLRATATAADGGVTTVVLDASRLTALDRAAVQTLHALAGDLARRGRQLAVAGLRPGVRELLAQSQGAPDAEDRVPSYPTVEQAVSRALGEPAEGPARA